MELLRKSIDDNDTHAIRFLLDSGVGKNEKYWALVDECIYNEKFDIAAILIKRGGRGSVRYASSMLLKYDKYDTLVNMIAYFSKCQLFITHAKIIKHILVKINKDHYPDKGRFIVRLLNSIRVCLSKGIENSIHVANILHIYNACINGFFNFHEYRNIEVFRPLSDSLFVLKNSYPGSKYYGNIENYLNFYNIIHIKTHDNQFLHTGIIDEYSLVISNAVASDNLKLIDEYIVHKKEYFDKFMNDIMQTNLNLYYDRIRTAKFSVLSHFSTLLYDEEVEINEKDMHYGIQLPEKIGYPIDNESKKRVYPDEDESSKKIKMQ